MSNRQRLLKILSVDRTFHHNYEIISFSKHERTRSIETALHYGFTPIHQLKTSEMDRSATRAVSSIDNIFGAPSKENDHFNTREKATLIKLYNKGHFDRLPSPLMLYREKINISRSDKNSINKKCVLDIIGVSGSIAEALSIQTTYAVLEENGFKNLVVEINSVGDKISRESFEQDLVCYLRSIMNKLPEKTQDLCKKNPHSFFLSTDQEIEPFLNNAPQPIEYLSEDSRRHLREILEYLEELDIPYTINNRLIAHKAVHEHAIFRIVSINKTSRQNKKKLLIAYGMRYNPLSLRLGYRKSTPAVGTFLLYEKPKNKKRKVSCSGDPRFCFLHLGFTAKLKSLKLITELRRSRIPVFHYLTKDKLIGQMSVVRKLKLPYIIIMGHKEALEGTVMIRSTLDHSQETVPLKNLMTHLKKLDAHKKRLKNLKKNKHHANMA